MIMNLSVYTSFCGAAKLYMLLASLTILFLIFQNRISNMYIVLQAALFIVWTFTIVAVYNNGYKSVAMTLAIFPHLIFCLLTIKPEKKYDTIY